MIKFSTTIIAASIFLQIISFDLVHAQCPVTKVCFHKGVFNITTCKCECLQAYQGEQCEFANCANQPISCLTNFGSELCSIAAVANYCPLMCNQPICKCGFDTCDNEGTFNPSTCTCNCLSQFNGQRCQNRITTTTTRSATTACTILPCLNSGNFNKDTCRCECFPAYTGLLCETLLCDNQPSVCDSLSVAICTTASFVNLCPILCGVCPTCSPCLNGGILNPNTCACTCGSNFYGDKCQFPVSTTKATINGCVEKKCNYGFTFDSDTCKCNCLEGFGGELCTFNCSAKFSDDEICLYLNCADDNVKRVCPNKCLCPFKPICLPCLNDGILDVNTCSCRCKENFSGERCQYAEDPCSFEDQPEYCSKINCWSGVEDTYFKCQRKCLCCGNKQCPNLTRLTVDPNNPTNKCECL